MRHRQTLTYDDLQSEARSRLRESDVTQAKMADWLDVNRTTIAKAVTQPGPKYQQLQMQVLEKLTGYEIEREEKVRFRVRRTDRTVPDHD
ncbi:hypothetical protein [Salinibacter ruber]|jgi:hypothetical protein|uniref:Uncharacterized protein n=1 Tax=Salinibacter ruber TaxID=146919 RepID=A0A9X2UP37_9BACT|nr:hypothetical protein [Salinibacter ruber]MCS3616691.1 hypothetical protein [Salinibacter ruber]MCS4038078.1 hypothetical protein [Salinibacter ruber]